MVQGGLLTAHPGSAHGGGEAPGGQSSLRQGAGTGSSGYPDLGIAAAVEQRKISDGIEVVLLVVYPKWKV